MRCISLGNNSLVNLFIYKFRFHFFTVLFNAMLYLEQYIFSHRLFMNTYCDLFFLALWCHHEVYKPATSTTWCAYPQANAECSDLMDALLAFFPGLQVKKNKTKQTKLWIPLNTEVEWFKCICDLQTELSKQSHSNLC